MPRATNTKEKPVPLSKDVKDQIIAEYATHEGDTEAGIREEAPSGR